MCIMPSLARSARARAGTNIAIVKYWGKRDLERNLPATGSLSLTLDAFGSDTTVSFTADPHRKSNGDLVFLNGEAAPAEFAARVGRFLDLVRAQAGIDFIAHVTTWNTVPTGAGLASSASGFAALAVASSAAAGLILSRAQLSVLARRGSGSAARSIFGGFVEMNPGTLADGDDSFAEPLLDPAAWPLRMIVAVTSDGAKALGSGDAMERTARTSPYYSSWLSSAAGDLAAARDAIGRRDLELLGTVAERSALRMHASAMAAAPPILYWNAGTVEAMHTVWRLRAAGTQAYITIDAGPHVKVFCEPRDASAVSTVLATCPGVLRTIVLEPGPGARLIDDGILRSVQ
jgi:diphosphomevalonate decarboxylase